MDLVRIKLKVLAFGVLLMTPLMLDIVQLGGDIYSNYDEEYHSIRDYAVGITIDPLYKRLLRVHGEISQGEFWAFFAVKSILFAGGLRF